MRYEGTRIANGMRMRKGTQGHAHAHGPEEEQMQEQGPEQVHAQEQEAAQKPEQEPVHV
tara:strand:+ start:394 stop:570 length:177 start_codon:yes stop_codon:yes gene_type:complete